MVYSMYLQAYTITNTILVFLIVARVSIPRNKALVFLASGEVLGSRKESRRRGVYGFRV